MISCWVLGCIIPLCLFVGYMMSSFVLGATVTSRQKEAYQHGYVTGYKKAMEEKTKDEKGEVV